MPSDRSANKGLLAFTAAFTCLLSLPACTQPADRVATAPAEDLFGEAPPTLDPQKAHLDVDDLEPRLSPPTPQPEDEPLPDRAQRAVERAGALRAERRYTEATIELEKALRYAPGSRLIQRHLALTQWEAGNNERARVHVEEALAGGDDDLVCHYLRGRLAARRFENTEAIRELRFALLCSVDDSTRSYHALAEYHLAETLAAEGYLAAAIDLYQRFGAHAAQVDLQAHPNPELAARRRAGAVEESIARAYEKLGRYREAAEHLRLAHAPEEMSPAERLAYARTLARAGELDAAALEAAAVLGQDPAALDVLARIREKQGAAEALIDDIRQVAEAHPEDVALAAVFVDSLVRFGRRGEAIALLRQRVADQPERGELAWSLFDLLAADGNAGEALAVAASAIRAKPEFAADAAARLARLVADDRAYAAIGAAPAPADLHGPGVDFATAYLRGVAAQSRHDDDTAMAWLEAAVAGNGTFVPARVALGEGHLARWAWEKALTVVAPADVKLTPDTRLEFIIGKAHAGLDEVEEAEAHYSAAIRLNRANTDAMLALAELYREHGEPARALRQLEALVKTDPLNEHARELLFQSYHADGDNRAAAEQLDELRRMTATPTCIARCVARLELDRGNAESEAQMRATLQKAIDAYRPDAQTLRLIAESHMRSQQFDRAAEALERASALDPADVNTATELVDIYRLRLDFEQALNRLDTLVQRYPRRTIYRTTALELLLVVQRFDDAAALATRMLAEPGLADDVAVRVRVALVQAHLLALNQAAALEVLERWHADQPTNVDVLRWLITTCQGADRHDRALELIHEWAEHVEGGFAARDMESIWDQLPAGRHDEVLQLVLGQIEDDPDNDALQISLIELLRAMRRFDEALELARSNVAAGRDALFFHREMYRTYDAAERADDAIALLNRMMQDTNPDNIAAFLPAVELEVELAQVLTRSRQFAKAIEKINRWIENAPSRELKLVYLRLLTFAQQEAGNLPEAIEALTLALELDPGDVGTHNDLGYTLADAGRDLDRAEELIRFAVAAAPRNSAYLDSLGWVLYKKGDFAGAKVWLHRSRFAGEGEDPVVCDHLGDACWRLGRKDEARQWWAESLAFAAKRLKEPWPRDSDEKTRAAVAAKLAALDAGDQPSIAPLGTQP